MLHRRPRHWKRVANPGRVEQTLFPGPLKSRFQALNRGTVFAH